MVLTLEFGAVAATAFVMKESITNMHVSVQGVWVWRPIVDRSVRHTESESSSLRDCIRNAACVDTRCNRKKMDSEASREAVAVDSERTNCGNLDCTHNRSGFRTCVCMPVQYLQLMFPTNPEMPTLSGYW